MKLSPPRVYRFSCILEPDFFSATNIFSWLANTDHILGNIAFNQCHCSNQGTLSYTYSWKHGAHGRYDCKISYRASFEKLTGGMWIIREHNVRKNPRKIPQFCFLANMNIAVQSNKISDSAVSLNIAEGSNLQVAACFSVFPNGHAMTCFQAFSKKGPLINNRT